MECVLEVKDMVQYKILERQPHDRLPVLQFGNLLEFKLAILDLLDVRLNILQIEPRIVVAKAVSHIARLLPCLRVEYNILRDESRFDQFIKIFTQRPTAIHAEGVGYLAQRKTSPRQSTQNIPLDLCIVAKHFAEQCRKVLEQRSIRRKAHSSHIFRGRQGWIYLFQIPWDSTCHRQDIYDITRLKVVVSVAPKPNAKVQWQLLKDNISRKATSERRTVQQILPNPGRHGAAHGQNEVVVDLKIVVPAVFEQPWKIGVMPPHPRYLVKKDKRPLLGRNALAKLLECLHPGLRKTMGATARLGEKTLAEIPYLISIRLSLSRPETLYHDESQTFAARKLLE